jgi:hypothetical protein
MRAGIVGSGEPTTHEITNAGCKKALKMVGKRERERERDGQFCRLLLFFFDWERGQVNRCWVQFSFFSHDCFLLGCFLGHAYPND